VFNFSGSEIFFLMILGLVILGPEKLPGVIRKAGKLYGEFKRITTDAQSEFKGAFGDTIGELKETAQGYKNSSTMTLQICRLKNPRLRRSQNSFRLRLAFLNQIQRQTSNGQHSS
jgi:Sec-independent protein translocase protein TatA